MLPFRALSELWESSLAFPSPVVSQKKWLPWPCFSRMTPGTQCSRFIPICPSSRAPVGREGGKQGERETKQRRQKKTQTGNGTKGDRTIPRSGL